jgi:hypothetical protein
MGNLGETSARQVSGRVDDEFTRHDDFFLSSFSEQIRFGNRHLVTDARDDGIECDGT